MKFHAPIVAIALALTAVTACSSSSDTSGSDTSVAATTDAAAKPDPKTVEAVFALDAAMRKVATDDKVSPQSSTVLLQLVANNKIDKSLTVAGRATDKAHILIWQDGAQRASAEDLDLVQKELEISSGSTSICFRVANDPALFITDVPAMPEQLKQYPKASGITKVTTDGKPACGKGKPE